MKLVAALLLPLLLPLTASGTGMPDDATLVKFFGQPSLSAAFSGRVTENDWTALRRTFQAMAESTEPYALQRELQRSVGVTVPVEALTAASRDAKALWDGADSPALPPAGPERTRLKPFKPIALPDFGGGEKPDLPLVSFSAQGGGGRTRRDEPMTQFSLMARVPALPLKEGRLGNLGVSAGINHAGVGSQERVIDSYYWYGPDGDSWENIVERQPGGDFYEFLRLNYQTPPLGRFVFELGMGLGTSTYDSRTTVVSQAGYQVYESGWCYDAYGYSYPCTYTQEYWQPEQVVSTSEGKSSAGFLRTVYGAASVALNDRLSLRAEVTRFSAWAAKASGTTISAGLTYDLHKR